jgi:hypothetical protein
MMSSWLDQRAIIGSPPCVPRSNIHLYGQSNASWHRSTRHRTKAGQHAKWPSIAEDAYPSAGEQCQNKNVDFYVNAFQLETLIRKDVFPYQCSGFTLL